MQKTDAACGQMPVTPNRAAAERRHSACLPPDPGHDCFPRSGNLSFGAEESYHPETRSGPGAGRSCQRGEGGRARPRRAARARPLAAPGDGAGGLGAGGLRAGQGWGSLGWGSPGWGSLGWGSLGRTGPRRASRARLINEANAEQTQRWWGPVSFLPPGACELLPGWRDPRGQKAVSRAGVFFVFFFFSLKG